jgi:hypothetical protein
VASQNGKLMLFKNPSLFQKVDHSALIDLWHCIHAAFETGRICPLVNSFINMISVLLENVI